MRSSPFGRTLLLLCPVLVAAGLHLSCDPTRFALRRSGPALERAMAVLQGYEDPELAAQAAPALLALLEGLLASDPDNPIILRALARGLYEYTFGILHLEYDRLMLQDARKAERLRLRARAQYVKVYELGLRMLRLQGVTLTLQRTPLREVKRLVAPLGEDAVAALTWTAVGAGSAVLLGLDQPWLMQMAPKIPVLLERAVALDPGYANALPVGALALYYARDTNTGGSAIRSQRQFLRAMALTKRRYLLWQVLYARYWAWQFQSATHERVGIGKEARRVPLKPRDKKALFVALLQEVRRFDLQSAPEHRLANTLAKRVAKTLWTRREDFLASRGPLAESKGGMP